MSGRAVVHREPAQVWGRLAQEAVANLYAVRQRSLLALLGIIIGTAAVVAMVNVGTNAGAESLRQFKAMGTDLIILNINAGPQTGQTRSVEASDMADLQRAVPTVRTAAPVIVSGTIVAYQGREISATVVGATGDIRSFAGSGEVRGRFLSEFDGADAFAVIGSAVRDKLTAGADMPDLGGRLRIGHYRFEIVGVLPPTAFNPLIPFDANEAVIVPLGSVRRISDSRSITAVLMRSDPDRNPQEIAAEVGRFVLERKLQEVPNLLTARQLIEGQERQAAVFTWLLAAIGGISLVVGGVGVMNVMLMSVAERRREIGVRMAVGARPGDIRIMFLLEAVMLSLLGGTIGTALGIGGAWGFVMASSWAFALETASIILGAGVAILVGLVFGLYPAVTASRMDPIEVLRAD